MGGKSGSLSGIDSAARFFLEASLDCFFRTFVSLAKESSVESPLLDLDELEELEDEVEDEVDEEDGITPSDDEEDEEVDANDDEVLDNRLEELALDDPSPSSHESFRLFLSICVLLLRVLLAFASLALTMLLVVFAVFFVFGEILDELFAFLRDVLHILKIGSP